eukprot:2277354-Rhodomonas_salina.3
MSLISCKHAFKARTSSKRPLKRLYPLFGSGSGSTKRRVSTGIREGAPYAAFAPAYARALTRRNQMQKKTAFSSTICTRNAIDIALCTRVQKALS